MRPPIPPDGWERRFIADPQRADEVIALYRQAGFEVRTESAIPDDLRAACESCWLVQAGYFHVIYTRRRSGATT